LHILRGRLHELRGTRRERTSDHRNRADDAAASDGRTEHVAAQYQTARDRQADSSSSEADPQLDEIAVGSGSRSAAAEKTGTAKET
jgi:hypothetical protein